MMMTAHIRLSIVLILALLLPSPMSWAEERGVLTFNRTTSSSTCIGDPVTPLCAMETVEACVIWTDKSLCEAVGYPEVYHGFKANMYVQLSIFPYEVLGRNRLMAADIPAWARDNGAKSWRAGDTALRAWLSECRPHDECVKRSWRDPKRSFGEGCPANRCMRTNYPFTYILRQAGDRWRLVDLFYEPVLQGSFWNRK